MFEVNEAFAAQALAVARELGLPPERTNPDGSGVSLGAAGHRRDPSGRPFSLTLPSVPLDTSTACLV